MHDEKIFPVYGKMYMHLYQLRPGDIIIEDLYSDYGILTASKGTVIDEHVIKRLETFKVRQLSVYRRQNEYAPKRKNPLYF